MMSNTAQIIKQCRSLPGVTVTEGDGCVELRLSCREGSGRMRFIQLFPGITLVLISVSAPSWPAPVPEDCAPEAKGPLIVNYCTSGRCELVLNDNRSVFMTAGHISLTERFARSEYVYPGWAYEGIELFIDPEPAEGGAILLRDHFGVDISALREAYCPAGETFIAKLALPEKLLERLGGCAAQRGAIRDTGAKTAMIDLLALLQHGGAGPGMEPLTYYTRSQVEMAKQIEAVVSGDLSRQHTAREFAALFSVSESSVKNYFRGVYGQSILQYATQRKMLHAAELLTDTALPVIEIASRVGYENQSKFSAVFRKRFGVSPREYRRSHRLLGEK